MTARVALITALLVVGCDGDPPTADSGTDTGVDAGAPRADAGLDAGAPPVEVTYEDGTVISLSVPEEGLQAFRGIPYAAPPVGDLRFRPPQPVEPWTEPLVANERGSACPQFNVLAGSTALEGDEDCLYLEVYTPDVSPATPLPVYVWIHGGAFILGESDSDVRALARSGEAVVVSLNYRLDQLGFLAHPALTAEGDGSGNWGLLDQRAALEWVRDHIGSFGGDPSRVTLAGLSAGAVSVGLHAVSPGSAGLFHAAELGSGPPDILPIVPLAEAEARGVAVAERVGCSDPDAAAACLRGVSVAELVLATDLNNPAGGLFYPAADRPLPVPNVDGVTLVEPPETSFAEGRFADVPYLVGTTSNEGTLFHSSLTSTAVADEGEYRAAIARTFPDDVDAILAQYPVGDFEDANGALTTLTGQIFNCRARRLARQLADGGATVWLYSFETAPEGLFVDANDLGAYHGAQFVFVWDLDSAVLGKPADDARGLVDAMQAYWRQFTVGHDPNGGPATMWPAYTTASDTSMRFTNPHAAASGHLSVECNFWDPILAP